MPRKITRRSFVGKSFAVAGSVALASGAARPVSPNDKIGIAVVGAGDRGGNHIEAWIKDPRTEILYIADADEKAGNKHCDTIAEQQGKRPTFVADMRRAFDDDSVTTVSTATPNHWHALCGIWAMQAGKDIYLEKPISHNVAEGSALVAAAKKYNRVFLTGTQSRSFVGVQDAVKFIKEGGIGEVNLARVLCYKRRKSIGQLGDYPIPDKIDFNLWSGPAKYTDPKNTRQRFHYDWHWQRLYGNGDSGNQAPHQADIARWGLGIDSHPMSVISYGGRLGYQAERKNEKYVDAGDTANTQVSIYDYGDKSIVLETRGLECKLAPDDELSLLFGPRKKGNTIGVVFYGSQGYVVQPFYSKSVALDKDFNKIKTFEGKGNHYGHFLDVCESRNMEDLNADARVGHLSASISHLGNISYWLGEDNKVSPEQTREILAGVNSLDDNNLTLEKTLGHLESNGVDLEKYPITMGPHLKFDPDKEVFPDSPQANEMLTREYRKGFVCPKAADV